MVPQFPAAQQAAQRPVISQFPVMQQGAPAQQQLMQNYYQQQQQQQQMMAQQAAMQQKTAVAAVQQKQQAPVPPQPQAQQSAAQPAPPQEQVVRALREGVGQRDLEYWQVLFCQVLCAGNTPAGRLAFQTRRAQVVGALGPAGP